MDLFFQFKFDNLKYQIWIEMPESFNASRAKNKRAILCNGAQTTALVLNWLTFFVKHCVKVLNSIKFLRQFSTDNGKDMKNGISNNNLLTIQISPFYPIYAAGVDNPSSGFQMLIIADNDLVVNNMYTGVNI